MNETIGTLRSTTRWSRCALLASLLAALVATAGCTNAKPPGEQLTVLEEQGRTLFLDNCALCHGEYGRGDGELPGVMTPAADLTRIAARRGKNFPFGEIALYIDGRIPLDAHRSPEMPVWGRVISSEVADPSIREEVTRGRISALVAYLRSIQVE